MDMLFCVATVRALVKYLCTFSQWSVICYPSSPQLHTVWLCLANCPPVTTNWCLNYHVFPPGIQLIDAIILCVWPYIDSTEYLALLLSQFTAAAVWLSLTVHQWQHVQCNQAKEQNFWFFTFCWVNPNACVTGERQCAVYEQYLIVIF